MKNTPRNAIKAPISLRTQVLVGSLAALGFAQTATAENLDSAETVIVRGERKAENPYADPQAPYRIVNSANSLISETINNTPKSIQVLPEELLEDMGINTVRDLFRTQPGITLGTGEGGNAFGDRIFIRGFDARNDVYIDGVRDPGVSSREVFAVQQIEIMKGPSSAFGGRGTTGGAVSMISKKPRAINTTSFETTIGTDDNRRVTIDTNRVLSDKLALRVNIMGHEGDTAGRDNVYNKRYGAAVALEYTPNGNSVIGFDYYHLSTDYMPDWGHPWDTISQAPANIKSSNFYGVKARDSGETYSDIYTLNGAYKFNDNIKLTSILRYGQTLNKYQVSAPSGISELTAAQKAASNVITNANVGDRVVRLSSPSRDQLTDYTNFTNNLSFNFMTSSIEHDLVVGIDYSEENTRMIGYNFLECGSGACAPVTGASLPTVYQSLLNPDFNLAWSPDARAPSTKTNIKTETTAVYFMDTIHITEKLIGMIGARLDNYATQRDAYTYATNIFAAPVNSETDFASYHLGLVYKPAENISIYTSYGTSSNPPCEQIDSTGVDYGGCTATTNTIDPIENVSFELGTKINLNKHIDVTAAYFTINREKVPSVVSNILYLENQSVNGVEITAAGNITKKWSLFAGLTMFDSNTDSSTNPNSQNLGKSFANVSEVSFSLTSKYQITPKFALGGTWVSQSEKFGGTYSAGSTKLEGFNRFDMVAEYKINKSLSLQLNGLNITDEVYYDAFYRSAAPFTYIAPGKSYSLTLDWHF